MLIFVYETLLSHVRLPTWTLNMKSPCARGLKERKGVIISTIWEIFCLLRHCITCGSFFIKNFKKQATLCITDYFVRQHVCRKWFTIFRRSYLNKLLTYAKINSEQRYESGSWYNIFGRIHLDPLRFPFTDPDPLKALIWIRPHQQTWLR